MKNKIRINRFFVVFTFFIFSFVGSSLSAKEYNQSKHLNSEGQAKVQAGIASAYRQGNIKGGYGQANNKNCEARQEIGNVNLGGGKVMGDVNTTTVIIGDAVNVNQGCR